MNRPLRLVAAVLLAAGCAPASTGLAPLTDADKAAIEATIDSALAIANGGSPDWNAYVRAYYAEDGVVYPPNGQPVRGHQALAAFFATFPPLSSVQFTTDHIEGAGGRATLVGRYTLTMTPPGGAAMTDQGKYIEIWVKRADGSWRSAHDLFNSDLPAAPAPAPTTKP